MKTDNPDHQKFLDGERTFKQVCEMIHKGHGGSRFDALHTFNALWRKAWDHDENVPLFTPFNAVVHFEQWAVRALEDYVTRKESRLPNPSYIHLPIVMARLGADTRLIDGHSRICMWRNDVELSKQLPVYVVTMKG